MSIQHVYTDDQYTDIVIALERIKAQMDIFQMFSEETGFNNAGQLYEHTLSTWTGSIIRDVDLARDVLSQASVPSPSGGSTAEIDPGLRH